MNWAIDKAKQRRNAKARRVLADARTDAFFRKNHLLDDFSIRFTIEDRVSELETKWGRYFQISDK